MPSPFASPPQPILWAAEDAPIRDAQERAILVALVMAGDDDGLNCFRPYAVLAGVARVDRKTAGRKCREMEARGILRRQTRHISPAWFEIPETEQPVVWEVMIPAEWWNPAELAALNERRETGGRPALTSENRPPIAPAPPKRIRIDNGKPRPDKPWDVLYVVTGADVAKVGITFGDPRARLAHHERGDLDQVVRLVTDLPDGVASELEQAVLAALHDAGERPVRGREYFPAQTLPLMLDLIDNHPAVRGCA